MRRCLLMAAAIAVLFCLVGVGASVASAQPIGDVLCCGGGGGTYCTSVNGQDHYDDGVGDWYTVYLGINYCYDGTNITSSSVQQNGCTTGGAYECKNANGPFLVGGGSGQSYVHWTYNSVVSLNTQPFPQSWTKTVDCYAYGTGSAHC